MVTEFAPVKARKTPVKETVGQRGKYAEGEVKKLFEKLNTQHVDFAFERVKDARSGSVSKALCDFMVWWNGFNVPLEVKSTEHDYRLSSSAVSQLPRLKKVTMAGAWAYVLVYFKKIDAWRVVDAGQLGFGVPSWDMRNLPTYQSAEQALFSTGRFPRLKVAG